MKINDQMLRRMQESAKQRRDLEIQQNDEQARQDLRYLGLSILIVVLISFLGLELLTAATVVPMQ